MGFTRHPSFRPRYNGVAADLGRLINAHPDLPRTYNSQDSPELGGIHCSPSFDSVSVSFTYMVPSRAREWVKTFKDMLPDRYRILSEHDNGAMRGPGQPFTAWVHITKAPRTLTPQETFDLAVSRDRTRPWVAKEKYSKSAEAGLTGPAGPRWTVTYTLADPDDPDDVESQRTFRLDHRRCLEVLTLMAQIPPPPGTTVKVHEAARFALEHPDRADLDADAADQLIQIAGYGEVVYS